MRNHNQTKAPICGKLLPTVLLLMFGVCFASAAFATTATSTIAPVTNNNALTATNGNKIVVAPDNTLHSVYAENGTIKYIKSSDGLTWTPPVIVSNISNATSPVIAVAGSGTSWTIGIAFVDGTAITPYYTRKTSSSPNWSLPAITKWVQRASHLWLGLDRTCISPGGSSKLRFATLPLPLLPAIRPS